MALVDNALCSETDMQRLFSAAGVLSFADHDADGTADTGVTDDCINQATGEIQFYCNQYAAADLADSTLVSRWATVLAVRFLCQRRGNGVPDSIESEYQDIKENLKEVRAGFPIPGVPYRTNSLPTMSNVRIDRRFPDSTVRVTPNNSTNAPTVLTQDTVPFPSYER